MDADNKPTPDPTILTTEQLLREISNVKEWSKSLVDSSRDITVEQFKSVETQFGLIERQRVEQKKDTKDAVDAALAAAKEAVQEQTKASAEAIGKSEALTKTQLEQLATQFGTGITGVADKYDDLKERLVRLETTKNSVVLNRDQNRLDYGLLVSVASVFMSIIAVVVVVLLSGGN